VGVATLEFNPLTLISQNLGSSRAANRHPGFHAAAVFPSVKPST
jgi:hypothetical protein